LKDEDLPWPDYALSGQNMVHFAGHNLAIWPSYVLNRDQYSLYIRRCNCKITEK